VKCHYSEHSFEETRLSTGLKAVVKLNVVKLGLFFCRECHYAQCHYAECCSAEC
jgi:hypothetical protein